jgi:hypothetical protein
MKQQNRIRKAQSPLVAQPLDVVEETIKEPETPIIPQDWNKGALLNVRNGGDTYRITLFPEEYDPRHPERTLHFHNSAEAQNFVSAWYAREQGGRPY